MSDKALVERYGGLVCDLDGVVYRGLAPVPHAVTALNALTIPVVYATNNASRTPEDVADHLIELGVHTNDEHVVNSSMAGAAAVAERVPAGSRVLAVGGPGVAAAIAAAGLVPVATCHEAVVAVLQGYGLHVTATDLAEAAYAVESGALWIGTNGDRTLPTERGYAPGNGALIAAVAIATGSEPMIVGKPEAPLYLLGGEILGVSKDLVLGVGDRLETDIAGATAAGMDGALVLTGVHGARDAALAPVPHRPRYLLADLRGLAVPYIDPELTDAGWVCDGWLARVDGDTLTVEPVADAGSGDPLSAVRAGLCAIWAARDAGADDATASALADQLPPSA